jgi:hypothetical protein
MIEKIPKRQESVEEVGGNEDLDLDEAREHIAEQFDKMSSDDKVQYARTGLEKMPERIRINKERTDHLNAQIENLRERVLSTNEAEKKFFEQQLSEKMIQRDEYVHDLEEMEDMIKHQEDFLNRNLN